VGVFMNEIEKGKQQELEQSKQGFIVYFAKAMEGRIQKHEGYFLDKLSTQQYKVTTTKSSERLLKTEKNFNSLLQLDPYEDRMVKTVLNKAAIKVITLSIDDNFSRINIERIKEIANQSFDEQVREFGPSGYYKNIEKIRKKHKLFDSEIENLSNHFLNEIEKLPNDKKQPFKQYELSFSPKAGTIHLDTKNKYIKAVTGNEYKTPISFKEVFLNQLLQYNIRYNLNTIEVSSLIALMNAALITTNNITIEPSLYVEAILNVIEQSQNAEAKNNVKYFIQPKEHTKFENNKIVKGEIIDGSIIRVENGREGFFLKEHAINFVKAMFNEMSKIETKKLQANANNKIDNKSMKLIQLETMLF
jgi:hypothetical protein